VRFARETSGATAIEYAILAAGIALVIITAVQQIGSDVTAMFTQVSNSF
jgi:pilus assembly protein Flp/PilA